MRARPAAVFEALAHQLAGTHGRRRRALADDRAFLVVVEHGRWYRSEHRVVVDDEGSQVTFTIVDVSRAQRPLGRFSGRTVVERAPGEFERMLRRLRLELEG